jgi:type IV pilus modification protein PilV
MKQRVRCSTAQSGFTLIECLVAIVILALGLTGVVGCFTAALVSNQRASHLQLATSIAQDTIEDMRSRGFGGVDYDAFPASSTISQLPGGTKTISFTTPYLSNARLLKVSVNVSWRNAGGATKHVILQTVLGNRQGHVGS